MAIVGEVAPERQLEVRSLMSAFSLAFERQLEGPRHRPLHASNDSVGRFCSRVRDKMAAYFADSVAKEAVHDHGRSGEQIVSVAA